MGFNGRRYRGWNRGEVVAALDVGSTKVVCFIARLSDDGRPEIVGIGHQASHGIRSGGVVDMESASRAVAHAVNSAEQMADARVRSVIACISGGYPASQTIGVELSIAGHEVGDADLRRALRAHHQAEIPPDCEVLHAIPVSYSLDGHRGVRDPRGMVGERLGVELHVVTAASGAIRNLASCIGRCHLEVDAFVLGPYASGLACLVDDERELGCTVLDMGGGTTGISVFFDGNMVFSDCLPVGGSHVTSDIARGLTTPISHAERIKTLFGAAVANIADEREIIDVPQIGEDEPARANHVPKSLLTGIIQPRLEEIFEMVRGRLHDAGVSGIAGRRVVLTGGASQIQGIREMAQQILDKQVRMGRPMPLQGMAEATCGPAFSGVAGLLTYAIRHRTDLTQLGSGDDAAGGWWSRVGGWLKESLGT